MKYEKRSRKDGTGVYYSFVGSDRKRLTREQIRNRFGKDITTEEEAKECLKLLEAKYEAEKIRIQNRLTWEKEFYNFASLLDQYVQKQKRKAPNSWKNNEFYLKHYVLYYFLQIKRLNNIEIWSDYYSDFTLWLETAKKVKSKGVIAVASRNHCIKALNTFLEQLYNENLIEKFKKCETFGQHLVNERNYDDVIHPEEMEKVYKELGNQGFHVEALYFRYLYFSGMRFNEGLCISLGDIFQGEIDSPFMSKKLKAYGMNYYGYIVSDGQLGEILPNGSVARIPFKGKKKIEEKSNRLVPIVDKELWNRLVEVAESKFKSAPSNKRDCLIFEGIDDATATRRLREAFDKLKLKWRPWHCLRHSRATWLIGETSDVMLARFWLGHTSPRTIEKYNHIYQFIIREARAKELTGSKFGLKKV